jgi:hypothetical protein
MLLDESTPSEYRRAFAEIARERPDALIVSDIGDLFPYRQLIVELAEKKAACPQSMTPMADCLNTKIREFCFAPYMLEC